MFAAAHDVRTTIVERRIDDDGDDDKKQRDGVKTGREVTPTCQSAGVSPPPHPRSVLMTRMTSPIDDENMANDTLHVRTMLVSST